MSGQAGGTATTILLLWTSPASALRFRHMKQKRFAIPSRFLLVLFLVLAGTHIAGRAAASLPAQLTDEQFWKLSTELSESDGNFRSDNLLSNELWFQYIIPELTGAAKAGRVYMGVGPEQNFTYIAALKPKMAFIVDIRRGNLDLHLMYKALFELSKDRAEFVGLLFSRPRPESLSATSSVKDIFDAYAKVEANEEAFKKNLTNIVGHLAKKHGFGLSDDDVRGVEYIRIERYPIRVRRHPGNHREQSPDRIGEWDVQPKLLLRLPEISEVDRLPRRRIQLGIQGNVERVIQQRKLGFEEPRERNQHHHEQRKQDRPVILPRRRWDRRMRRIRSRHRCAGIYSQRRAKTNTSLRPRPNQRGVATGQTLLPPV